MQHHELVLAGVLFLATGCTAPERASETTTDPIAAIVREELARQNIPGASVAIVEHGRLVHAEGYGFANLEHEVPATKDTIYQSGSTGKQFTAALVLLLANDGRFGLDDPIAQHLPGTPPSWEKVTIRQLLQHVSGLADPYEKLEVTRDYTEAELLAIDGQIPLLFEPGTKFSYSNMGYHVLGFLCSHVGLSLIHI
jgi:CubicO group peptidase (beta-lactamase class C family)